MASYILAVASCMAALSLFSAASLKRSNPLARRDTPDRMRWVASTWTSTRCLGVSSGRPIRVGYNSLAGAVRKPLYRDLRSRLRNGEWAFVVKELQMFADDDPSNTDLVTELGYLRRHAESGRLVYADFRQRGLPLGSGAIESGIRESST